MTHVGEPFLEPPKWARAFLLITLPCDPIRDAVLGDLHEDFLRDAVERDARWARARYVRRAMSIGVRALSDAVIWREWVSTAPVAQPQVSANSSARASAIGGFAGFVVVALIVLVVGVVVNTLLFSATDARGTHVTSAAGIGGVVVLVACVGIGTAVICVGPRWRRKR